MWTLLGTLGPALAPITTAINTVIDRLVPDVNAAQKLKNEIELEVAQADLKTISGQLEIDKAEAASSSMFVAGGRPAFIWLCVITLGWYWLGVPTITWTIAALGAHGLPPIPTFSADEAQTALYGLLGLGGMRSLDKVFAPAANITKSIGGVLKGSK
jgi:holin (3TMs family)